MTIVKIIAAVLLPIAGGTIGWLSRMVYTNKREDHVFTWARKE